MEKRWAKAHPAPLGISPRGDTSACTNDSPRDLLEIEIATDAKSALTRALRCAKNRHR